MIFTRRMKALLITVLSVLFLAVLVMMAAVLSKTFTGLRGAHFGWPGRALAGDSALANTTLKHSYTVSKNQTFALSVPLGEVTVVPGKGQKVELQADLEYGNWFVGQTGDVKHAVQLLTTKDATGVQVTMQGLGGRVRVKQAEFTLTVPKGVKLDIHNNLGVIQIDGGTFTALTLHDNMGAIRVGANVTQRLNIQANMGAIKYNGRLAEQSKMVNNMGTIDITDAAQQSIDYRLTTSMGEAKANFGSSHISDKGTNVSGTASGSGPVVHLTCTNNMGDIHLQGE